ncbi:hypothetical protein HDV00_012476 [Rhizophlyctis rosea]|nr:hypothetical protein HDV00_012476 [Rhizophlyctis rosea]
MTPDPTTSSPDSAPFDRSSSPPTFDVLPFVCGVCKRQCGSGAGLASHQRHTGHQGVATTPVNTTSDSASETMRTRVAGNVMWVEDTSGAATGEEAAYQSDGSEGDGWINGLQGGHTDWAERWQLDDVRCQNAVDKATEEARSKHRSSNTEYLQRLYQRTKGWCENSVNDTELKTRRNWKVDVAVERAKAMTYWEILNERRERKAALKKGKGRGVTGQKGRPPSLPENGHQGVGGAGTSGIPRAQKSTNAKSAPTASDLSFPYLDNPFKSGPSSGQSTKPPIYFEHPTRQKRRDGSTDATTITAAKRKRVIASESADEMEEQSLLLHQPPVADSGAHGPGHAPAPYRPYPSPIEPSTTHNTFTSPTPQPVTASLTPTSTSHLTDPQAVNKLLETKVASLQNKIKKLTEEKEFSMKKWVKAEGKIDRLKET